MNTLDKKFEQLMKGIKIDSPSKGFSLKVIVLIQAEAAVQKHSLLENYQPVISRKVWIVLIVAFISLIVYILFAGKELTQVNEPTTWSLIPDYLQNINMKGVTNVWQSATGLITSIPSIAYLIMMASMVLWTLDIFLTRLRHSSSVIQMK